MPEFFDLRPPVVLVEEDRTARKEDRRQFEQNLDRYLELKEKLAEKIALGQNISWDDQSEFIVLGTKVLQSVIVIGSWQLGADHWFWANHKKPAAASQQTRTT
jgi:hypothetical protein